jgi:hypothetical protein
MQTSLRREEVEMSLAMSEVAKAIDPESCDAGRSLPTADVTGVAENISLTSSRLSYDRLGCQSMVSYRAEHA